MLTLWSTEESHIVNVSGDTVVWVDELLWPVAQHSQTGGQIFQKPFLIPEASHYWSTTRDADFLFLLPLLCKSCLDLSLLVYLQVVRIEHPRLISQGKSVTKPPGECVYSPIRSTGESRAARRRSFTINSAMENTQVSEILATLSSQKPVASVTSRAPSVPALHDRHGKGSTTPCSGEQPRANTYKYPELSSATLPSLRCTLPWGKSSKRQRTGRKFPRIW